MNETRRKKESGNGRNNGDVQNCDVYFRKKCYTLECILI